MKLKRVLIISVVTGFLTSCATIDIKKEIQDGLLEMVSGKAFSRNFSQCYHIKRNCQNGNYDEFILENGQKGCACN